MKHILSLIAIVSVVPLTAAASGYLKVGDIKGESADSSSSTGTQTQIQSESTTGSSGAAASGQIEASSSDDSETRDKDHKGEIDIESFGSTEATTSGGSTESEDDWRQPASAADGGDPDRPVIQGEVPNSAGIEHEDIGIVDDDDTAAQYEESDLEFIRRLSSSSSRSAAIYIKIEGVEGESDDTEAASKPKEIVVVGSKVRGWDPETKERVEGIVSSDPVNVQTAADLSLFVARHADEDENIEDVRITEGTVEVEYYQPAKLFGLFNSRLRYRVEAQLDDTGRIKVRLPWYRFLYAKSVSARDLEEAFLPEVDDEVLVEFESGGVAAQARTFQTISNVMKAAHDTAMAVIRKIG